MSRGLIKQKTDASEISKRTAQALGLPVQGVQTEVTSYWVILSQFFSQIPGHSVSVDGFGTFLLHTKQVSSAAKEIEKRIIKLLRLSKSFERLDKKGRAEIVRLQANDLITKIILLNYTCESYNREVRSSYPKKYKINDEGLRSVIGRLEKLLGFPLDQYPITLNYQVQKIFVQKLRKQKLLRNPVIDRVGKRYGHKNTKVQ